MPCSSRLSRVAPVASTVGALADRLGGAVSFCSEVSSPAFINEYDTQAESPFVEVPESIRAR